MKIKIEVIVIVIIIAGLIYLSNLVEHDHQAHNTISQCDPMEQTRLKVVLEECSNATMYDVWEKPENK